VTPDAVVPLASVSFKLNILLPVITGVFQGSIYGLIALGIVLLYKSNRIFNFAQGEFGSVAAIVANSALTWTVLGHRVPYAVAMLFGLVAGILTAILTERLVIRPLFDRPKVTLTVATVGVALFLIAVETLAVKQQKPFEGFSRRIPALSKKPYWFAVFGRGITYEEVLCLVLLILLAIAAGLFFTKTSTGVAILAVSQEATASSLVGISIGRISLVTWALAGFLGATAGLLLSPITGLAGPGYITGTALFTGITAAVLGGVTSLSGAFVGGIAVGVLQKLTNTGNLTAFGVPDIPGLDQVIVGLALLVILLVRPRGLLGKET
jgi:branched-chain amino acid transport system permease protein